MAEVRNYRVLRRHDGDRLYEEGETRVADAHDVKHLVGKTLEDLGPVAGKAEPAPLNKAESAAPANKAATGRKGNKA